MIVVVMGVAGCGKTTVGRLVARRLGARLAEGDAFHPAANVEKMRAGQPLDDADRWPWLAAIAADIRRAHEDGAALVVACSALKRAYRDVLRAGGPVRFVHLTGAPEEIGRRIAARRAHYMPASLLPSQLAILEPPGADEDALTVDIGPPAEVIAEQVLAGLAAGPG